MKLGHRFFVSYLDNGERILYIAHKHVLMLKVSSAKTSFLGIVLPVLGFLLFPRFILIFAVWILVGVIGLIYHFFDWYLDAWVLTNAGVIDIDGDGFFSFTSTRVDYHMIEGMSYTVQGFLGTVFNYGTITLDKLGAKTSVVLKDASNPKALERLVMKYQEQYVVARSVRDHQELKGMLSEMIAYHIHNNKLKKPSKDN